MRQVYIDLTTDNARLPGGDFVGYLGEHNATELLISIPQVMVDASDYQVVVMQAGPLMFKTKHIDEDKAKKTYRDGNTIHTKLSKSLTRFTPISIQVEAYKLDESGKEALVGKTQTVPHLVLKPSPEGTPAFNYDGSFEDVESAIEYAHKHDNIDVLESLETDDNGNLLFNGQLVESIKSYDTPLDFPLSALEGTVVYAMNDASAGEEVKPLTFKEELRTFVPRHTSELKDFTYLKGLVEPETGGIYRKDYQIHDIMDNDIVIEFMYIEGYGSLMLLAEHPQDKMQREYNPPKENDRDLQRFYIFNPGEPFDLGVLTGGGSELILANGWSVYESFKTNFRAEGDLYVNISSDTVEKLYEVKDTDYLFLPFVWSYMTGYDIVDEKLELDVINKLFEVPTTEMKKGLYIYDNGSWQSISEAIKKQNQTVEHFIDLPMDAATGSLGFVTYPAPLYVNRTDEMINLVSGSRSVYLNPYPMFESRIVDIEYELSYGMGSLSSFVAIGTALYVKTCLEHDYAMVTLRDFSQNIDRYYLYSWKDQSIIIDGLGNELTVKKGWTEVLSDEEGKIDIHYFDDVSELPYISTGYVLKGTHIKVDGFENAISYYTDLFSSNKYIEDDNKVGLYMKTDGMWLLPF